MPTDSVRNWGEAFMVSMTNAMNDFLSALPSVIEGWYRRRQELAQKAREAAG